MQENNALLLFEDAKQLRDSAREDYDNKHWDNHSYHVAQFNELLERAKDLGIGSMLTKIQEAEADQQIPTSSSSGTPYHPRMVQSVGSKTRKLREVVDAADKLFRELSTIVTVELHVSDKKAFALSQLQKLIKRIAKLKAGQPHTNQFKKWKRDAEVAIGNIFPQNSRHLKDFGSVDYYPLSVYSLRIPVNVGSDSGSNVGRHSG